MEVQPPSLLTLKRGLSGALDKPPLWEEVPARVLSQKETSLETGLMPPLTPSPLLQNRDGTRLPAPLGAITGSRDNTSPSAVKTAKASGRPQSLGWPSATHLQPSAHIPETHPEGKTLGNKACLLGTPDTSRSGRNTRKARRALTSKPPDLPPEWLPPSVSLVNCSKITLNNLKEEERKKR